VEEGKADELRAELASLAAEEARISAERRRLHHQIDSGFATDSTRAREQEVSQERRRLHERIDALQELLGVTDGAVAASPADWMSPGFSRLDQAHTLERERSDENRPPVP
jgi:uncharacterized membrane protein YccC